MSQSPLFAPTPNICLLVKYFTLLRLLRVPIKKTHTNFASISTRLTRRSSEPFFRSVTKPTCKLTRSVRMWIRQHVWAVISAVVSKLNEFSRLQTVMYMTFAAAVEVLLSFALAVSAVNFWHTDIDAYRKTLQGAGPLLPSWYSCDFARRNQVPKHH